MYLPRFIPLKRQTESRGGLAVASEKGVTVAVDTELTPELVQEGYARDFVRQINDARKNLGFEINDRVHLFVQDQEAEVSEARSVFVITSNRKHWRSPWNSLRPLQQTELLRPKQPKLATGKRSSGSPKSN